MSPSPQYTVVAADTLEERKRHRIMIEEKLSKLELSEQCRHQLETDFRSALQQENCARKDLDDARDEEDERKKRSDGGDDGGQQSTGAASGSSSGGSSGGMVLGKEGDTGEGDASSERSDFEAIALLFFLAEQDFGDPLTTPAPTNQPVAAMTLMLNQDEGVAHIQEPYMGDANMSAASAALLPSLEAHAAKLGARELRLQVQADAAPKLQKEFGYKPEGQVALRGGVRMQMLRKKLICAPMPAPTPDGQ